MKITFLIIIIVLLAGSFSTLYIVNKLNSKKESMDKNQITNTDINPEELKQYLDAEKDIFLLDVHTPEQEHIQGTDAIISFDKLIENKDLLPKNKNTEIVVYCRSGNMSVTASKTLLEMGYTNVKTLVGGTKLWNEEGY